MKERRSNTIADVAEKAGVSVGSVSHVLSGRTKVSDKLRERVMKAVAELSYTPNFHAQGLRQGSSYIVGLSLPHSRTAYMSALLERIEEIASDAGYVLMHVFSRSRADVEQRRVKELMKLKADGLILFTTNIATDSLDYLAEKKVPTVLIDRSNGDDRFDQVILDNRTNMQEAVNRLVALGHRNLAFVFRSHLIGVTQHRLEGLHLAQQAAPEPLNIRQIEFLDDQPRLQKELRTAFRSKEPPTAIITSNSDQAAATLSFLRVEKIRVPEDVSVITFDEPDWSRVVSPPLSVIRQPANMISDIAWTLLMQRIASPDAAPQKVTLKAELLMRESVGPPKA